MLWVSSSGRSDLTNACFHDLKQRFSGSRQARLIVVAVSVVEVEVVDPADSNGGGVDDTGRHGRGLPVLKLNVGLYGEVMGEVVVQADAGGVDEGVGADVGERAE